ncbi:MAG: DUF1295 domain-containing protein [Oscillospiraceae bacterium]|nr:DUF1295 domain-containing protein [Oscillospiraceae bacterium]
MSIWGYFGIFFVVSLLCCAIGFKKYVYFLSVGYGFSVIGLGIAYLVSAFAGGFAWNIVTILQCVLFVIYGARLSGFLLARELKNGNYRKVLKEATKEDEKPMPVFVKIAIWICVGLLYFAQTSPVFYRIYNGKGEDVVLPLVGVIISACGLILESISDKQKSAQKAENPNMVATKGLFKMVRCPNYLGEIIFWTGVLIGSVNALHGVGQWIVAVLGWILIVMVMFNGAQRLDRRQEKRYGSMKEYRDYADHTPIILPLIPLYHVGKYK